MGTEWKGNDKKSLLMFLSSMLIFGTIGIFRRYIPVPSAFLASVRGVLGGLFLLLIVRFQKNRPAEKLTARQRILLTVSGAVMGINWILLFEAYNHTTVAAATLCYYMQPTIVMLLSPLIFREKLTPVRLLCVLAAVAGMVLVSGAAGGQNAAGGSPRGILLGLGAACFYAGVVIMNKKLCGIEAYRKTTIQLFSAGTVMVPYLLLTGSFPQDPLSPAAVLLLAAVGIIHTGAAYVLYFGSMDGLKTQSVAILSYADPVSAMFFAAVFLGEPLTLPNMIGAALIIGAAVVSEIKDAGG